MAEDHSLEGAWRAFARAALPAEASESRRHECRRCFYAGAETIMGVALPVMDSNVGSTRADRLMIYELVQEINDHARRERV